MEDARIVWFATFMTGEVYGVLREHSILGRLTQGEANDPEAFARGLAYAGAGGSGLLKRLFSARTLALFDRLPGTGVAAYLSGLLIGSEIEEALQLSPGVAASEVLVVGSSALADRYMTALAAKRVAAVRPGRRRRARPLPHRADRGAPAVSGFKEQLEGLPLVAILRGLRPEQAQETGAALVEAGFRAVEVPLNSPDPFASIRRLADVFGAQALVGAGTVLRPDDVARVADAGGRLVVMPHGDPDVVRAAKRAASSARPASRRQVKSSPPWPRAPMR